MTKGRTRSGQELYLAQRTLLGFQRPEELEGLDSLVALQGQLMQ